jgi:HicB family
MTSETKQSGRANFLLRMDPALKASIATAATKDGVSINDWLLDAIDQKLADRDAEVAAGENKAELERRRDQKFQEIAASLAGAEITSLSARKVIEIEEKADAAIAAWCNHAASHYHAEPRTLLERLCKEHVDLDTELEGVQRLDTFEDDNGRDFDDDGDEPEPDDE